jgi:hypothetical protein
MDQNIALLNASRFDPRFSIVLPAAVACWRVQALLLRALTLPRARQLIESSQRLAGAMFTECLTIAEKSHLTVRIYDTSLGYNEDNDRLSDWEETWFARRLPVAPARLLVGACGRGREAIALVKQGYQVTAFEPAPALVATSQRHLADRAAVLQLSYEELCASVLDGERLPGKCANRFANERFDAVLLGLGSLSHVLEATQRTRLLHALNVLCPTGPILASFSSKAEAVPAQSAGRAASIGRCVGRAVAYVRAIPPQEEPLNYRPHYGFAYSFTAHAIEELAREVGRVVAWDRNDGTRIDYATLLPTATPGRLAELVDA